MTTVRIERYEHTARVILNRAAKRNAISAEVASDLEGALLSLAEEPDLRVVVLSGDGPSFCAGADVGQLSELTPETAERFIRGLHRAIAAAMACPVPIIAAIRGACIGAGLELAAGCDMRIASQDARFSMPEVKIGVPSVIEAALLPRLMGRGRAARLVLTGETIDAQTALDWGLVEELVAGDDLMFRAGALAAEIAEADPLAVRAQKRLLRAWDDMTVAQAVEASVSAFADSYRTDAPRTRIAAALTGRT
ncbi:MAG: enoyl-CoA hydratase-related protein [Alphaproteobacteria bacterium]|nr:enoyl-CoA hydratase-related protein [Alphaproteobacteria bacterium]